jgi:putative ABC transport system permease protein
MAWVYLWNRKLTSVVTILSVALAVALICAVLTLREETRRRFEEEGQAFDLVVGAKGSPLQLVLSSVYFMDQPTGNMLRSEYEAIKADTEYVAAAFPLNMGDTYRGFRIVGTVPELFQHSWTSTTGVERRPFVLAQGRYFAQPLEAVVGAQVAEQTGLKVGDTFISTHGFIELPKDLAEVSHEAHPYTVVGVLQRSNTPFDRVIFCSLDTVWDVHANVATPSSGGESLNPQDMITAVLVQLQSPGLRWQFKEFVRDHMRAMAAIPVEEIRKLYDQFLTLAKNVLLLVGYLVVVVSALGILTGLYLSILQRRRDLAVMRALGASAPEIFGVVLIEAFWITLLGIGFGLVLGKGGSHFLGRVLSDYIGLSITGWAVSPEETQAYAVVLLVGLLAGILPAWQAYHRDVAADLAEH